jgi:hypothetical protein
MQGPLNDFPSSVSAPALTDRCNRPVFVLGCPRSGTTVLYHMLLSAGDFAVYRSESNVFNLLAPRFGGMRSASDRRRLMRCWLRSLLFRVSGLDAAQIEAKINAECHCAGDFLRIVMGEVARVQKVRRWADCTPEHLLYMEHIKRQIPDALFIHIIRDGRDVALSYIKQGWAHTLPWDGDERLAFAGLYWEWMVRKGREQGKSLGQDYQEVRFEELVANPHQTLSQLGKFVEHDLDYERIRRAGIGSVSQPNSSFAGESEESFNPVARWKTKLSSEQKTAFESLVGDFLRQLEYPVESESRRNLRAVRLRTTYLPLFGGKLWLRDNTVMGRFVRLERLGIEPKLSPSEALGGDQRKASNVPTLRE